MSYRTTDPALFTSGVIVDLSPHADKFMAGEDVACCLTEEQELKVADFVRSLALMSYNKISRRYSHWQEADRAHDVYVPPESTDFREKAVIGTSRAVADTVVTYMMAAITGRNPMFMLEGMNRESRRAAAVLERILHQQTRRSAGEARLAQLFLDEVRYGFAPTKVIWDSQANTNRIINFNPRRVFPDPRIQWGEWDEAQYHIFSATTNYNALKSAGIYEKIEKYPALRSKQTSGAAWAHHKYIQEEGKGLNLDPAAPSAQTNSTSFWSVTPARVVDECHIRLSGWELGLPALNEVWLIVTILDGNVCIRFQLNPYGRMFPVTYGSLYHDCHKAFGQSLYDIILPVHHIMTWLLRSRVDNVQAALNNLIFADPTKINIPDLIDRNPWGVVRTLPGVNPGEGMFVANIPDVTRGHWNDIGALADIQQRLSAASDAQQGVPTTDVRSATEIQRLTQLGSQRLGVLARISSAMTIRPIVRMMVSNIQDAINFSGSIRVPQDKLPPPLVGAIQSEYLDFTVSDLQGKIEYLVVDGTLPIEPTRSADTWINMLTAINQTGLTMEYKAGRILDEAIRSMGINDLDQFRISPEERQLGLTPSQQLAYMEKLRGASVMPDEQIAKQLQQGNLVPMQQTGG